MKKIIFLLIISAALFSCKPKTTTDTSKGTKKVLSFTELSTFIGEEQAFRVFELAGKTESAEPNAVARGGRKVKGGAVINGWFDVLVLTQTGPTSFTCTTPINPKYSAFQNLTKNQSPFYCNYWVYNLGPAQTYTCNDGILTGGDIRFFTADYPNGDIYISNVISN